jgi:hypothetical protein
MAWEEWGHMRVEKRERENRERERSREETKKNSTYPE